MGGEKPGFPRFRGKERYDSFTYPQSGFELSDDNQSLRLAKIGTIRVVFHRQMAGEIKTCTLRKTRSGKWYTTFSCELPDVEKVAEICNPVGVDCGLNNFITLSNGEKFDAPKFFRQSEETIARLGQRLSVCEKGSLKRKETKKRLALAYERVCNRRSNYAHHVSRWLVANFDCVVFEDLSINKMIQNHKLAKSIQDVAWNQLVQYTIYKAEEAGGWVELVDPAYTSQTCSNCGNIAKKSLSERRHSCACGCEMDRDENAAVNILRLGMQSLEAVAL
jgi:putative transposase